MKFQTSLDEIIFVARITPEQKYMFDQDLHTGLSIIWNKGEMAQFEIDQQIIPIPQESITFLTEYHIIEKVHFEKLNVIQFNRPFYCVEADDSEVGCKGLLFFGASDIPKIVIPPPQQRAFDLLWEVFLMEMEESDALKREMLQTLLKRFLILCLRVFSQQNSPLPYEHGSMGLIREFNYLVEKHYKQFTRVADYAELLHKSPKTLANIFHKYMHKSPLQVINERRLREAKRLLRYSDKTIQEIAEEINFRDIQSFSHFFRSRTGSPPRRFRQTFGTA